MRSAAVNSIRRPASSRKGSARVDAVRMDKVLADRVDAAAPAAQVDVADPVDRAADAATS